jgi:hypothetical protein
LIPPLLFAWLSYFSAVPALKGEQRAWFPHFCSPGVLTFQQFQSYKANKELGFLTFVRLVFLLFSSSGPIRRTKSLVSSLLFAWRYTLAVGSGASRLTTILITTHHIQKRPCQGCEAPPEAARP